MKNLLKNKLIKRLATPLFCAAIGLGAIFSLVGTQKAYAYNSVDEETLISNLYNEEKGKFDFCNMDKLAKAAGFEGLKELIQEAQDAHHDSSWAFAGSEKFASGTTVNLGSYEFNGETRELNWIPVYLSNDKNGNAVLTLWLSAAEDTNGVVSNQEVATFTDGTYDGSQIHTFNEKSVVSNTYSSSYVHNVVLNGRTEYDGGYSIINETEDVANYWQNPPALETMTKFSEFAEGGALSQYIIAPEDVPWQMALSGYGNDPSYSANAYYDNDWTKDKVWLPSMSETNRSENNLWQLTPEMCSYNGSDATGLGCWWTRSSRSGRYDGGWALNKDGVNNDWRYIGKWTCRVRPAIHLNLSVIEPEIFKPTASSEEFTYDTTEHTYIPEGFYSDLMEITGNKQTDAGNYSCTVSLKADNVWEDGTNDPVIFPFKINQAPSNVVAILNGEQPTYVPKTLPEIGLLEGGTAGTIAWDDGQTPLSGTHQYNWTFTPSDTKNYTVVHDSMELTFEAREIKSVEITAFTVPEGEGVYTNTTTATLKEYLTVTITYKGTPVVSETTNTYDLIILDNNGKLVVGDNRITVSVTDPVTGDLYESDPYTITGVEDVHYTEISSLVLNKTEFKLPVTAEDILNEISAVRLKRNNNTTANLSKADFSLIELAEDTEFSIGDNTVTFRLKDTDITTSVQITISKNVYDIPDSLFTDKSITYTGTAFDTDGWIDISKLPQGVTVSYSCNTDLTSVGEHVVTAKFVGDTVNYEVIPDKTAKLTITQEANPHNHTEGEWIVDSAATCTEAGSKHTECADCGKTVKTEEIPALGHSYKWEITKLPTKDETGLKQNKCTVCGNIDGEEEIAKLVSDGGGKGDVIDLEPDKEYDLEILVKPTNALYTVGGVNVGYEVALWIVVDGERAMEYDNGKVVTLMLRVPDEMVGKDFQLYKVNGIKLDPVENYEVDGNVVTLRTTLSAEIVFHTEQAPENSGGIPWWVWVIVAAGCVAIIIIVIVVIKKKKGNGGGNGGTVVIEGTQYDDAELKAKLSAQDRKLDEIKEIVDGGFNDVVDGE